jgi:predicted nucleic acid-binding protein
MLCEAAHYASDRLHLAIIESLGLRRLLTNDDGQARAARGLGFEVTLPR